MYRTSLLACGLIALALRVAVAGEGSAEAIPFEFRGVMSVQGQFWFRVNDSASQQSTWVAAGGSAGKLVVHRYDSNAETLFVSYLGRSHSLRLRQERAAPIGEASAAPHSEAERAQYRDKIYAEMMRRRAERQEWLRAAALRGED